MAKLFPPFIESKLPAFAGSTITVYFTMNRAVSLSEVTGMYAVIKTAQTGKVLGTLTTNSKPTYDDNTCMYKTSFSISNSSNIQLEVGQYYKIQIAYKDILDEAGYYSSVAIIKKTATPTLSILNVNRSMTNIYDFTGQYSQSGVGKDKTEKIYSYYFEITDMSNKVLESSGELLHNSLNDNDDSETIDTWCPTYDFVKNVSYKIKYGVTTVNGLQHSVSEIISVEESVNIDIPIDIESKLNYNDGTLEIYLCTKKYEKVNITGKFVLVRASSLTNFEVWDEVYKFNYSNFVLHPDSPKMIWEDFSVQQGEEYLYALQAYNNYIYSNRLTSKNGKIQADFEYSFLSDIDHQLKIMFNPHISSIKDTIQETKIETIGSKYPFIFRNGYVKYKEFPITGLLSLLSDSNNKFSKFDRSGQVEPRLSTPGGGISKKPGTDLSSENIYNERHFKMDVLEWLNNGKPKIFRSPTEGNFIVRTMNSSLQPNDTLGRMLHSFSCTAYEIADWNFKNLKSLELIGVGQDIAHVGLCVGQVSPADLLRSHIEGTLESEYPGFSFSDSDQTIWFPECYSVKITDATPGKIFKLWFTNNRNDGEIIEIGTTGTYNVQIATQKLPKENVAFLGIGNLNNSNSAWGNMKINFEYYNELPSDTFSKIYKIDTQVEIRRFVGPGYSTNLTVPTSGTAASSSNILSDVRREIGMFYYIKVEKRYIQDVWSDGSGGYFRNRNLTDTINESDWNDVLIYRLMKSNGEVAGYYNGKISNSNKMSGSPDFRFALNDTEYTDLGGRPVEDAMEYGSTYGRIELKDVKEVHTLKIGNGLIADVAYRVKIKNYTLEESSSSIKNKKNSWIKNKKALFDLLNGVAYEIASPQPTTESSIDNGNYYYYNTTSATYVKATTYKSSRTYYIKIAKSPSPSNINEATNKINSSYRQFITSLETALKV